MTAWTVFSRTLMKSSAICLGIAIAVVHPSIEGGPWRHAVAEQSPAHAAVDGLVVALTDPDPGVRRYAAVALGELRSARAVPALVRATRDEQAEVRLRAVIALAEVGDPRAVPATTALLKDCDPAVRGAAARALADLGRVSSPSSQVVSQH